MNWYYSILGGHTHVHVSMNGAFCGYLCFRNAEFEEFRAREPHGVTFIDLTPHPTEDVTFPGRG